MQHYLLRLRMLGFFALTSLILAVPLLAGQPAAAPQVTLPPVTANALDHAKIDLPSDFSAPLNLLVLSFARDQQSQSESWIPVSNHLLDGEPRIQLWMLPISSWQDSIYKWWLNSSMRSNLPDVLSAHYTVPLYVNKAHFLKALDIRSERQIVVLLTDKKGLVLWRSDGAATDEKKASLAAFLEKLPPAR
jgi:hypothetical protein